MSTAGTIAFCLLAVSAVLTAWKMIVSHHPVHSALYLVSCLLASAGVYLLLGAPFIALVQVAVYAGAIMVLFLFILMYLNIGLAEDLRDSRIRRLTAVAAAGVLVLLLLAGGAARWAGVVVGTSDGQVAGAQAAVEAGGTPTDAGAQVARSRAGGLDSSVEAIGVKLVAEYTLPFWVAGVLLLVAMIGAILIAGPSLRAELAAREET